MELLFFGACPGTKSSGVTWLASLHCSSTVWAQYVLQSESQPTGMPSGCYAPGALVWLRRPETKAACYSKWRQVTVVSVWPGIRNTFRLETDNRREMSAPGKQTAFCLVED